MDRIEYKVTIFQAWRHCWNLRKSFSILKFWFNFPSTVLKESNIITVWSQPYQIQLQLKMYSLNIYTNHPRSLDKFLIVVRYWQRQQILFLIIESEKHSVLWAIFYPKGFYTSTTMHLVALFDMTILKSSRSSRTMHCFVKYSSETMLLSFKKT